MDKKFFKYFLSYAIGFGVISAIMDYFIFDNEFNFTALLFQAIFFGLIMAILMPIVDKQKKSKEKEE